MIKYKFNDSFLSYMKNELSCDKNVIIQKIKDAVKMIEREGEIDIKYKIKKGHDSTRRCFWYTNDFGFKDSFWIFTRHMSTTNSFNSLDEYEYEGNEIVIDYEEILKYRNDKESILDKYIKILGYFVVQLHKKSGHKFVVQLNIGVVELDYNTDIGQQECIFPQIIFYEDRGNLYDWKKINGMETPSLIVIVDNK